MGDEGKARRAMGEEDRAGWLWEIRSQHLPHHVPNLTILYLFIR